MINVYSRSEFTTNLTDFYILSEDTELGTKTQKEIHSFQSSLTSRSSFDFFPSHNLHNLFVLCYCSIWSCCILNVSADFFGQFLLGRHRLLQQQLSDDTSGKICPYDPLVAGLQKRVNPGEE